MRPNDFQMEMNRLMEQFGKGNYSTERCKILWKEVQEYDATWFAGVIDKFIGESRHPPLMPDFREEISRERERLWRIEKRQHSEDAKSFFDCKFDNTEKSTICKTIIARMQGKVSDADYAKFVEVLESASKPTLVRGQSG